MSIYTKSKIKVNLILIPLDANIKRFLAYTAHDLFFCFMEYTDASDLCFSLVHCSTFTVISHEIIKVHWS